MDIAQSTRLNITMLDHIILTVSDLPRSIAFYSKALVPLGIIQVLDYKGQNGHPDLMGFGRENKFLFWLKSGQPSPAAVHFAFVAKTRAIVDPPLRRDGGRGQGQHLAPHQARVPRQLLRGRCAGPGRLQRRGRYQDSPNRGARMIRFFMRVASGGTGLQ